MPSNFQCNAGFRQFRESEFAALTTVYRLLELGKLVTTSGFTELTHGVTSSRRFSSPSVAPCTDEAGQFGAGQTQRNRVPFPHQPSICFAVETEDGIAHTAFYPRIAQRRIFDSFGGVPCIRMATRKMRPPTQTKKTVKRSTPRSPTHGCQAGTPPGVLSRRTMSRGVKGGIRDIEVAKLPIGSFATGK